jgi:excisionase family DNA binding protein
MTPDAGAEVRAAIDQLVDALLAAMTCHPGAEARDRLLSIDEAARSLGVGRTALYAVLATGELRSLRVGRRRLVPASAVDEYIASATSRQGPRDD